MKRMVLLLLFPLAVAAQSLPLQPVKPPPRPKIAGSMVGYVDDAAVGSQVRVRLEAGFHNDVPDRAEFFYGKCGCFRKGADKAAGPGPEQANNISFQQLYLHTEYAPTSRVSLFAELPFRRIQPGFAVPGTGFTKTGDVGGQHVNNLSGISDLRAGVKMTMVERPDQALTLQVRAYFPSGDAVKGLGTGHYSVEPSLLYYRKLSDRTTLESQVGDWHPTGGSKGLTAGSGKFAGDVAFYGLGVSHVVYESARFKLVPVAELVGWHVVSGYQTTDAGGTNARGTDIVNLKAGVRLIVDEHSSFYAGFGQALTRQVWYEHLARVEYRYSF
ncbi:MAG: hypothetical protein QOF63_1544 [Thermoanaerobaculia bacterium]|nr:hypothetical protein [Thermoanaerobaculia bacterium]